MTIDYIDLILHVIVAGVCASTYWKAAAMEDNGPLPIIWCLASLTLFALTWRLLEWRWPGIIGVQVGLGVVIGVHRAVVYLRETKE